MVNDVLCFASGREFEIIADGKTKNVRGVPCSTHVFIKNKNTITRGDGQDIIEVLGKGVLATTTTCNCFELLQKNGISTHFVKRIDKDIFSAYEMAMIPIEVVIRRVAKGSILKRSPEFKDGQIFKDLKVEFFFKDDSKHDPFMEWNSEKGCFELHNAKMELGTGYLKDLFIMNNSFMPCNEQDINKMKEIAKEVFLTLEKAFLNQKITLIDLKIEFGINKADSLFETLDNKPRAFVPVVADVIDNDSWRVASENSPEEDLSKQVFRDAKEINQDLKDILFANYAMIAEVTKNF